MSTNTPAKALDLLIQMMNWASEYEGVGWEASSQTIKLTGPSSILWTVQPRDGGPVRIQHDAKLENASLHELTEVVADLMSVSELVDRNGPDREEFEASIRNKAKSLLRRKSASGIRLVQVVSEPINSSRFRNICAEVTFELQGQGEPTQVTYLVGDEEELESEFDRMVAG